jgi:hypothetical protein
MKIFIICLYASTFIIAIVAKLSRHFLPSIRNIFGSSFSELLFQKNASSFDIMVPLAFICKFSKIFITISDNMQFNNTLES